MKYFLSFLFIAFFAISYAQPGTPDKSYGTDKTGTITNSFDFGITSSTIQQDNKLILGGSGYGIGEFIVARRNEDGSPDTDFGKGGEVITDISNLVQNIIFVSGWTGVVVQPDGKIVAMGYVEYQNPDIDFDNDIVLARFLPDGTPDKSFGSQGIVITELDHLEIAYAVALQKDGKIVVAGQQINNFDNNGSSALIVRYNTDGTLDNKFGNGNGYVIYTTPDKQPSVAASLLIQTDGKIVVGGAASFASFLFLVRYLPDGSLDESFGSGGRVTTGSLVNGSGVDINSLALDDKGRIVASGIVGQYYSTVILRYLPDGTTDNSFDKDGQVVLGFHNVSYRSVTVSNVLAQPGSKIVVSSALTDHTVTPVLSGLNEDGSPDVSFGTDNGQTIVATGLNNGDANEPAVMQSDGKIVVASGNYNYDTNDNTYLLSRFNGYPVHVSLAVRIKRYLQNHGITWNGLPANDNIAYYSVEQSSSKRTGFTPIAKLSGRSNLPDYSFTNSQLLQGSNYYRIKAVSTDGTIRYSEVVSADNITNSASVYPNPASNSITVKGLPGNETANISIKDGSGTVLSKGVSSGNTQYRSSLTNLQPGTYYVNITTATKTETLKFVKE